MYEPPIEVIYGEISYAFEGEILKAVQKAGINVDKDELIKALKYDRDQYSKGHLDGMIQREMQIIRCKDCEWWDSESKEKYRVCHKHNTGWKEDDYCSFADMREGDAE